MSDLYEILGLLDDMTEEQLSTINKHAVALIKHKRTSNNMDNIIKLKTGDRVSWENTRKKDKRYGQPITGVIISKGRTKIQVRDDDEVLTTWTIPASMVNKIDPQFNPLTGDFE